MVDSKHYTYRVCWSEVDQEYLARCSEFPHLVHLADSPAEALTELMGRVQTTVESLRKYDKAPVPSKIADYSGRVVVRVHPTIHKRLVQRAAEQGVSLKLFLSAKLSRF